MALSLGAERDEDLEAAEAALRPTGPIVPAGNVASRALFAVLAIMTFLSCMTVGAVVMIAGAASEWSSDIASEITVQVRPSERTAEEVAAALEIVQDTAGVTSARALSDQEISRLLEPWLGGGLDIEELPVPRLVVATIDRSAPPDIPALRRELATAAPSASVDDHDLWQARLASMAGAVVVAGLVVLALVLTATVLSVVFATRGAMATNRGIVEVLHLVGAKERFIARQFERHFLRLGLKGGLSGGLAALACFGLLRWWGSTFRSTAAGSQLDAMFGTFAFGWDAVLAIGATVVLVAVLTSLTSRLAVFGFLKVFD
ncbi:cell division protein FtsX [Lutibaculum baratangense]|uniref:Cell division protein FtsX n=1 Tax=Lutibaculum baratangense AMV1 TaxID=631454 RepID=V4RL18_9HYPH|nr:ABC transporter permease [Lutibaculum baratangense]ESR23905.1 Cell division protein FtsX [Lutibaculum baratangense AMV1]